MRKKIQGQTILLNGYFLYEKHQKGYTLLRQEVVFHETSDSCRNRCRVYYRESGSTVTILKITVWTVSETYVRYPESHHVFA